MTTMEHAALVTVVLAVVGLFTICRWIGKSMGEKVGDLVWIINIWSKQRAYNSIGQAILDYEFDRGVNGRVAYDFAHGIMRGVGQS